MSNTQATLQDLNEYIQEKKESIKQKIHEAIFNVERHFNVKFTYDVIEIDNNIVIKGVEDYCFTVSKWFQSKINSTLFLKFSCTGFPFTVTNSHKSIFFIAFNDDFDIDNAQFRTSFLNTTGNVVGIKLYFDNFLNLQHIENTCIKDNGKVLYTTKTNSMISPFYDEALLFKLSVNKSQEIKDLLPEYYIPSAYNFQSEDFKDRLAVYEMMTT